MKTAVITFKIDANVKEKVKATAADLGLSMSSLMSGLLMDVVRTGKVSFGYAERPEELNEKTVQLLNESIADYKSGRFQSFKNADDFISHLNKV